MFLLFYGRHVGAPRKGTNMHGVSIQSSINLGETLPNNAGLKNSTDLDLGEVVCLSIIYHIPDS